MKITKECLSNEINPIKYFLGLSNDFHLQMKIHDEVFEKLVNHIINTENIEINEIRSLDDTRSLDDLKRQLVFNQMNPFNHENEYRGFYAISFDSVVMKIIQENYHDLNEFMKMNPDWIEINTDITELNHLQNAFWAGPVVHNDVLSELFPDLLSKMI